MPIVLGRESTAINKRLQAIEREGKEYKAQMGKRTRFRYFPPNPTIHQI